MKKLENILVSAYQLRKENPTRVTGLEIPIEDRKYIEELEEKLHIKRTVFSLSNKKWIVSFDFTEFGKERAKQLLEDYMSIS